MIQPRDFDELQRMQQLLRQVSEQLTAMCLAEQLPDVDPATCTEVDWREHRQKVAEHFGRREGLSAAALHVGAVASQLNAEHRSRQALSVP